MSQQSPAAPNRMIPLCEPYLAGQEWTYVKQCLDSNWVSSVGSFVDRFEREVADVAGSRHAVATSSGTAALHTALLVAGVEAEDEVLVSTLTFIASANAIRYAGAWPVLIDAEPQHWQMDPELVEHFLTNHCHWRDGAWRNRQTGRRVRAIMPVHVLGHPVDLDRLLELAARFELLVVEDAAEALGTRYKGQPVGSAGHVGCFSFNGNKLITTGGGGMLVTDREDWAARARYLTTQAKDDPVEYVHGEVGYNYRLTNIQAALGCAQLERLAEYIRAKQEIAARYRDLLDATPGLRHFQASPDADCTYWMYTIEIDPAVAGITSRQMLAALREHKIQTRPLWQPLHQSPAHQGAPKLVRGVADGLASRCLSLPCSVGLSISDQVYVCEQLRQVVQRSRAKRAA